MKTRAGLLVYRVVNNIPEVLISHHGGPLWAKKDDEGWSIFKGEVEDDEELKDAAKREFEEETSQDAPSEPWHELGSIKRKDGKIIHIWAVKGDYEPKDIKSNTFTMEWPPRSGKIQEFPENDRADWFDLPTAMVKLHEGQQEFIRRLAIMLPQEHPGIVIPDLDAPHPQKSENPTLF